MSSRIVSFAAVLGAASMAVGCASNTQARIDRLEQEKSELQQKNYELKTQLAEKDSEIDSLKTQPGATAVSSGALAPSKDLEDAGISIDNDKIVLPDAILFSSGQWTLTAKGKAALDKVGKYLKEKYALARIHVIGHTDNDPIRHTKGVLGSNWDLSGRRASTVVQYLVDGAGFEPQKVFFSGFGETRPKADNKTSTGKAQNRRVEIAVLQ